MVGDTWIQMVGHLCNVKNLDLTCVGNKESFEILHHIDYDVIFKVATNSVETMVF